MFVYSSASCWHSFSFWFTWVSPQHPSRPKLDITSTLDRDCPRGYPRKGTLLPLFSWKFLLWVGNVSL